MGKSANEILTQMCDHRVLSRKEETALYNASRVVCKNKKEERARTLARDTLLRHYLKLIVKIAFVFSKKPDVVLDLVGVGVLGLMHIIDRKNDPFDPDKGRLGTIASYWIRRKIVDYLYDQRTPLKGPSRSHMWKLRGQGREEEYDFAFLPTVSLDTTPVTSRGREEVFLLETVVSEHDREVNPEDATQQRLDCSTATEVLQDTLGVLNKRERYIICARRLCVDGAKMHLKKLSLEFNISAERVRQIELAAMKKMKKNLLRYNPALVRELGFYSG